eukprot:9519586-Heterocapsa_arctica.AAC.1
MTSSSGDSDGATSTPSRLKVRSAPRAPLPVSVPAESEAQYSKAHNRKKKASMRAAQIILPSSLWSGLSAVRAARSIRTVTGFLRVGEPYMRLRPSMAIHKQAMPAVGSGQPAA